MSRRCEHTRPNPDLTSRTHRLRCRDTAEWVISGRWLCDTHARDEWEYDVAHLFVPRDRSSSAEAGYAPWAADALRAKAERIAARAVPGSLFDEETER